VRVFDWLPATALLSRALPPDARTSAAARNAVSGLSSLDSVPSTFRSALDLERSHREDRQR
jgi:hypothetical protein